MSSDVERSSFTVEAYSQNLTLDRLTPVARLKSHTAMTHRMMWRDTTGFSVSHIVLGVVG